MIACVLINQTCEKIYILHQPIPIRSMQPYINLELKGLAVEGCGSVAGCWFGASPPELRAWASTSLHPGRQPRPKLHRSRPKLQPADRSNANFIAMSVALRDGRGAVGRARCCRKSAHAPIVVGSTPAVSCPWKLGPVAHSARRSLKGRWNSERM